MFARFFGQVRRPSTTPTRRLGGRWARYRPHFDRLEDRVVPAYTATLAGTVATFDGDANSDTISFSVENGNLRHDRVSVAGDNGFASDFDFDTTQTGDQMLAAAAVAQVIVNADDGNDQVNLGNATVPASALQAAFDIDASDGNDLLQIDDAASTGPGVYALANDQITINNVTVGIANFETQAISGGGGGNMFTVSGTTAPTTLDTGAGDDLVTFGAGATLSQGALDGGAGNNSISFDAYTSPIAINLATSTAPGISLLSNVQNAVGGAGDDTIRGDARSNLLRGGPGADQLFGEAGNDALIGDTGNDQLFGGTEQFLIGLDGANNLLSFAADSPGTVGATRPVTGLQAGETLLDIDVRPATGQLYGLTDQDRLYVINPTTGAATLASTLSTPVDTAATTVGIDFNPVPDRLRIVTSTGQNLRVNVDTGAVTTDTPLAFATGDPNAGDTPAVAAVGYTNSFAGTAATRLFGIDVGQDVLTFQNPPNNGTLATVGALGVDATGVSGFEVADGSNIAYAALTVNGVTQLYTINLATGSAAVVEDVGTGGTALSGLTVVADSDIFIWNNGDGSDVSDGGAGTNVLQVNGSDTAGDQLAVSTDGSGFLVQRTNLGQFSLDNTNVAQVFLDGLGGDDTLTVGDVSGGSLLGVVVNGGDGNDLIDLQQVPATAGLGLARASGDFGNDTITGTLGNDALAGSLGNDQLFGLDGNDALDGEGDNDQLDGGAGTDSLNGGTGNDTLLGGTGNDLVQGLSTLVTSALVTAIDDSNNLLVFQADDPTTVVGLDPVTGLQTGETLVGIDFRPANGVLYGLTDQGRIYTINRDTAAATLASTITGATLAGTAFGIDFNPVPDRLRVTSNTGQNLRINVDTGAATLDSPLAFATGDPNASATPSVGASAYTNSFGGAVTTALYNIDTNLDILALQNPPNDGTLTTVGLLGVGDVTAVLGFDVLAGGNTALAALQVAGASGLYSIDLTTGAATLVAPVGVGTTTIGGLAVVPDNDLLVWNNGDGSDTLDGGVGFDFVQVNGSDTAGDNFTISVNATTAGAGRVVFDRTNLGLFTLDIGGAELLDVNGDSGVAGVGNDTFTLNDLTGVTDLQVVDLDGGAGNDLLDGTAVATGALAGTNFKGGAGSDTLLGTAGSDILNGGEGNDSLVGNQGNDQFDGSTGTVATLFGLGAGNTLVTFAGDTPGTATSTTPITGLQTGETIADIDVRPATGALYALTDQGRLYTIDAQGMATLASTITGATLDGTVVGIDFNPVPDRLRIVTNTGQNLRVNVDTGAATVDTALDFATGDPNAAATPAIGGVAYTNSAAGTTATTLFDIDIGLNVLAMQNPPNNGTLVTVGPLGVGDVTAVLGFDILAGANTALAVLRVANSTGLYTIDLTTGAATLVGALGDGTGTLPGLTIGLDNDILVWNNGDGSDTMNGGNGQDTVQVNGSTTAGDAFTVSSHPTTAGRTVFARTNLGMFTLDIATAETLDVNGDVGADSVTVNDLTGVTDLQLIDLDGGADADVLTVTPGPAGVTVNGGGPSLPLLTGDVLTLNLASAAGATLAPTAAGAGQYTFTDLGPVTFSDVESVVPGVTVSGVVFDDRDGDGTRDVDEVGLANFTLRLDANNDGTMDLMTVSDVNGNYSFSGLTPNAYLLSQDARTGFTQTSPASPGTYLINVTDGGDITGRDFGNRGQGPSDPTGAYISKLYLDLLGRPVDASGLQFFRGLLTQGVPRAALVNALTASSEYRTALIQEAYQDILGRAADDVGVQSAAAFLQAGGRIELLRSLLIASDEFFANAGGGTNAGFLTALYQRVLGRAIEDGALQMGQLVLNGGVNRVSFASAIVFSNEAQGIVVREVFQRYLDRQPDITTLNSSVGFLQQVGPLEALLAIYLSSDEYFAAP